MRTWSFYRLVDGQLLGRQYAGPEQDLEANTPAGARAIEGRYHPDQHRVELVTDDFGEQVPVAVEWTPEPDLDLLAREARAERDRRLGQCDWVVLRAQDLGQPVPAAWQSYRQSLRDIPSQPAFPLEVDWPAPPT